MPSYRGNVGNLLQHWVLCELLSLCSAHHRELAFIDAYSMAPLATARVSTDDRFTRVRNRLPGEGTPYEQAWHRLAGNTTGYPNSAQFVTALWPGPYSLLLCEVDPSTIQSLRSWSGSLPGAADVKIWPKDWRQRFSRPLPSSPELTMLSFDPNMFDRHGHGKTPENMDPSDLQRVTRAIDGMAGPVLIQLSTYSPQHGNAQTDVQRTVESEFQRARLQELAVVRVDGRMMSMVYGRGLPVATLPALSAFPSRFTAWLHRINP